MEERRYANMGGHVGVGTLAYPPTPIEAVMGYLHSSRLNIDVKRAVFRRLQAEVATENLERLNDRLAQLVLLEKGWDGEDALPVNGEIAGFVGQLLKESKPSLFADWSLFPNVNGTLLLQKEDAGISIGKDEFSYFAENENGEIGEDNVPLTVNAVKQAIKQINNYVTD